MQEFPLQRQTNGICRLASFRVAECVSIGYTDRMATKDSGLRIRVQRDLRDQFLEACRVQDRPAAQVLREFMRKYIAKHQSELAKQALAERRDQRAERVNGDQRAS